MDFWDTQRGDPKARRRESLKTFSVTPATFRGIWHWRVSAISLSGPVSTLCSCPSCNLLPWLPGEAAPTPPGQSPAPGTSSGLLLSLLHSATHSPTHSFIGQVFLLPLHCARHCTWYLEPKYEEGVGSKHFREIFVQSMSGDR